MTGPLGVAADDGNLRILPMIPVDVPLVLGGAAVAAGGGTDDTGDGTVPVYKTAVESAPS